MCGLERALYVVNPVSPSPLLMCERRGAGCYAFVPRHIYSLILFEPTQSAPEDMCRIIIDFTEKGTNIARWLGLVIVPPSIAICTKKSPLACLLIVSKLCNGRLDPTSRVLPMWSFLKKGDRVATNVEAHFDLVTSVFGNSLGTVVSHDTVDLLTDILGEWHRILTSLLEEFVEQFLCLIRTFIGENN